MGRDCRTSSRLKAFGYIAFTCLCLILFQGRYAFGQVDEGAITGTVQDTTGAVVPGAQVTLLNVDQGITLTTKSNASGGYTFSPVRIGHYSVTVTAKGFSKTTQKNLTVQVAQVLQVNVQLKPGAATETVEVTTAPPLLQTEEASVGQVIGAQEVNNLPLNGRNFTFLAQLGAGMQTPQADTRGNAASGAFSANGLRPAQNNYLLDGIDNNSNAVDFLNGTNFVILPPVDAIQEFKVQTADFSAELGRSAGAVLNATIKSGTNSLHGTVWEFLRNDKLDAADWFENNGGIKKGELRLNQFGASAGGPIIKNKMFFFGDYEGKRRVQGTAENGNVPTALERSSGFTDLSDVLSLAQGATKTRPDLLGRTVPYGTILDPATTRLVAAGAVDPVSGLTNNTGADGYVRDPFGTCGATPAGGIYTIAGCGLNKLPANRVDANAIKLMELYPAPNSGLNTYSVSPNLYEHSNTFDTRFDFNPTEKEQIFFRFSYSDDPIYIPGIFGGIADGGSFSQGIQTAKSDQAVAAWTHVFTPTTINQVRGGFAHLHTTRTGPEGGASGIPGQFGIQGIPQGNGNGGLPAFGISNLATLGSNSFLPSDEVSQTLQLTDDFTKIYGKHSFKMGIENQHVKFSTLQPAWSRGQFNYGGGFTDIPTASNTTGGLAQFLLPPTAAPATLYGNPNPNGFSYSGGANQVYASNINKTYDAKTYFATYFQDDWKVNAKLTINLGLRWDYFGPINETNGGQANFVPGGAPENKPLFIIPASGKDPRTLSTDSTCFGVGCRGLVDLLAKDGITLLSTNKYGQGLLQTQKGNIAPRVGFAYEITPKLVTRGGFGLFFNSFENQGYGPNIGENYPFVFNFSYSPQVASGIASQVAPTSYNTPFSGCATAGPGGTATFESGFSCIPFDPTKVNALGLGLQGLQFDYQTPRTYSANLTFQYSLTRSLSAQASYVFTNGQNLQGGVGYRNVSQILPHGISTNPYVPFADFGGGSYQRTYGESQYHGLQTKLEQQFSNGLTFLLAYTYSKTMSDAGDLLNGGTTGGLRAFSVKGLGPRFDWALANFDIRQVLHFSGGYELPFGKDRRYMNRGGLVNAVLGDWSTNWIVTLQGGQPLNFGCPTGTTSGTGCNTMLVKGQSPQLGIKVKTIDGKPRPFWINNPSAYTQPCQLGGTPSNPVPIPNSPSGCVPLTGAAALGGKAGPIPGPGFHRLDFSTFKGFQLNERFSMQFRAEFFNILNHPNFNAPNFGGNGVVAIGGSGNIFDPHFGELGSTRDAPYDPRQIQLALKLYY
ncbi:MAG: TonB-dependent receptor [Acidobacteriota bacterium]|nr:TonB-dependent receptor [Acidobacteriota bacterium]